MKRSGYALVALFLLVAGCGGDGPWPGLDDGTQKIVFSSRRTNNSEIYTMKGDGSRVRQISQNVAWAMQPSFSHDGKKIVFSSTLNQPPVNAAIYTMDADGSNVFQVTSLNYFDHRPHFNLDDTKILFSSARDIADNGELYVVDVDGQNLTNLTDSLASETHARWSPGGSKIIYSVFDGGNAFTIWTRDANGANPVQVNDDGSYPCYSPDGSKIVYRSNDFEIWIMDADGTNQIQLTDNPANDTEPCFSPDGRRINFTSDRNVQSEIFSMKTDGTDLRRLTVGTEDSDPSWSFGKVK